MRVVRVGTLRRLFIVAFVICLVADLARTGTCCHDDSVSPAGRLSVCAPDASSPGPSGAPHIDHTCFCCALSIFTSVSAHSALETVASANPEISPSLALPELPAPYHPPQFRS